MYPCGKPQFPDVMRWKQNTLMSHRHLNGSHYSCTDKNKLLHVHICMVVVALDINVASTGLTRAPFCIPGCMKINAFYCCTLNACVGWGCEKVRRERWESIWLKQRTALVTAEHILQEITFIGTNRTLLTILQAKWKRTQTLSLVHFPPLTPNVADFQPEF